MRAATIFRTLLIGLLGLLNRVPALADAGDRTIFQFQHKAWGSKEGAPTGILALAQTIDGYLWLGTAGGLYRFDGVRFERYEPQSGAAFPAPRVRSLLSLPNGDLWIGFQTGEITLLRNGIATNYTTQNGLPGAWVTGFVQDREGTIWAATLAGLARLEGNQWKEIGKDWNFPERATVRAIFLDRQGTLWVASGSTLVYLPPGAKRFRPTGISVGQVVKIAEAPNGKLWMAETTRSVRPVPLGGNLQPSDETEIKVGSAGILFDREGALWITTLGDGMRRAAVPERLRGKVAQFSGAVESFTTKDGLTDDVALPILQGREGNIWVGTTDGLDRFRKTNLVPIALPINVFLATLVAGDAGDVWIYSVNKMLRVHGVRTYTRTGQLGGAVSAYAYRDSDGVIWWVAAGGVFRFENGHAVRYPLPNEGRRERKSTYTYYLRLTKDRSGVLWAAADKEGLFYLRKGVWERFETPPELAKLTPTAAFTDWMGRLWFAYAGGTIIAVDGGKIQTLSLNGESPIRSAGVIQGRDRHVWVGGDLGLAYFDGSRFRSVVPAGAATFTGVSGIEETPDGDLWLCENRGLIHIPATELRKTWDSPSYRVQYELFDSLDGLPGTFQEARGADSPREIQGTDGRLWLVASKGVAWIDPANISRNAFPPPTAIESLRAGGRQYASGANLKLPARTTNLQIGYTALSLSIPERVRFQYRLEGVDKDWQDAGTRREAFYTNLGPGHYRFQVIASNDDGVWNNAGAILTFSIASAWFQTIWFKLLCLAGLALAVSAIYQLRILQIERRFNIGLEARLNERTRIARDLHDTLLQSLHGLMFQFQAARNLLPRRPDEAMQSLDDAINETERALAESRDAIRDLRSEPIAKGDLAERLMAASQSLAASERANDKSPTFNLIVEGEDGEGERRSLSPIFRDEIYRIARELILNAFRHAGARRIEAEIRYDNRVFRLRIRDDGQGIDPKVLKEGGPAGHWGLRGVRERAQRIGAQLDFWSEVGAGTEVQLTVPAAVAYEKSQPSFGSRLIQKVRSHGQHP